MVGDAIKQSCGHFCVAEYVDPFTEAEVSGDDQRGLLIELADEVEEQSAARLREGQIAKFIPALCGQQYAPPLEYRGGRCGANVNHQIISNSAVSRN